MTGSTTKTNGCWLLIIDNVDDKAILDENDGKGKGTFKLLSCIPKARHGHVLFTTRYRNVALELAADTVHLDHMPEVEALNLIRTSLKDDWHDDQAKEGRKLLEELSCIPLAIVHACCYMRKNQNTIADYLELYRESEENRAELLEEPISGLNTADDEAPKTALTTTWLSLDRLRADEASGMLAIELLAVMSFLDRQDIPISLLRSFRPKVGNVKNNNAYGVLKGYSLVNENITTKTCSMHRLVQLCVRRWLDGDRRESQAEIFQEEALTLLSERFPDGQVFL